MIDENLIHELFPHRTAGGGPSYRQHQFEVIRDALQALSDSDTDTVVIEAPTGSGKTDIAKTVALYMTRDFPALLHRARFLPKNAVDEAYAIMAPGQAHVITSMKLLQDAYLKTRGRVSLIKGKGNYPCTRDPRDTLSLMGSAAGGSPDFSCHDADLFYGSAGCGAGKCSYQDAKDTARWTPIALHNFDSFLSQCTLGGAFPSPRALITLDEAHNIEDKIVSFASVDLISPAFRFLGLPWTTPASDDAKVVSAWVEVVSKNLDDRLVKLSQDLANERVSYQASHRPGAGANLKHLADMVKKATDIKQRIGRYVASNNGKSPMPWVAEIGSDSVRLEPVKAGRFVKEALLKWGHKRLLLSATFLDGDKAFSRSVNLGVEKTRHLSVPSTFPADRRPLIRRYVGDMGFKGYEGNFEALSKAISEIMDENKGVRGVVHCTSYQMSEALSAVLAKKRFVWHGRDDRVSVVNKFLSGGDAKDAVLVGVGLTEGYDFRDDLCRFQLIIRLPYQYPSKRVKARSELDPRFSDWRACLTLVQTYGRGMRGAEDSCRTYILDSRFNRFLSANKKQLPAWFQEAIR